MKEALYIAILLVSILAGIWFGSSDEELTEQQRYVLKIYQN